VYHLQILHIIRFIPYDEVEVLNLKKREVPIMMITDIYANLNRLKKAKTGVKNTFIMNMEAFV
jgi:hypothetical protein